MRTKQGSSNTKDSTTRATTNKFVSVDDSIAKPTSNEFMKAADDITIHVGESASKFEDGTNHREQICQYRQRYRDTRRRRELRLCLLEGLATDARPLHVIDTAGGGWLVCKYGLRPTTPPYLREGLARVNRLAPPASPSLSSDLSDATDRLDELLLRTSPAGSSSIASDVVAELNDLVPPRPEPARRSTRLAQRPRRPPAAPEEDEEPVVDAAQIVLRRVRANRARSQA